MATKGKPVKSKAKPVAKLSIKGSYRRQLTDYYESANKDKKSLMGYAVYFDADDGRYLDVETTESGGKTIVVLRDANKDEVIQTLGELVELEAGDYDDRISMGIRGKDKNYIVEAEPWEGGNFTLRED